MKTRKKIDLYNAPWIFLLGLIVCIALAEITVMLILPYLAPSVSPFQEALLDAAILTLFILPPLWWLVIRPLRGSTLLERLRAEKAVRNSATGILSMNHKGLIESANPAAERMFGYAEADLIGRDITMLIPSLRVESIAKESSAEAPPLKLKGLHQEGEQFPIEALLAESLIAGRKSFFVFIRDVTLSTHVDQRRNMQYKVLNIISKASSPAAVCQPVLEALCMTMGYKLGEHWAVDQADPETLRLQCVWHVPELDASEFLRISQDMTFRREVGIPGRIWANAQALWIKDIATCPEYLRREVARNAGFHSAIGFPIHNGHIHGVIVFYSDEILQPADELIWTMTDVGHQIGLFIERKELERLLSERQSQIVATSKLAALGEMAGGIAHEINNPLAIIHTLSGEMQELIQESKADHATLSQSARKIETTALRISKIVQGLRAFAREGSKDPCEKIGLGSIVENTVSLCRERFKLGGIKLMIDPIPEDLVIESRSIQLSQVLLSLLNNAFDAAEKSAEKWVRIRGEQTETEIELSVIDSGAGIPQTVRDKLFQPFFTTKEIGKGTGLGLSIARGIIEDHGGTLRLSQDEPHTRFAIRMPKLQQNPAAAPRLTT
ncbi:MAG: PAS domain S-box protein [Deltaproteobacteria bacterium]|nr:PAS domain S-box protein [Deltaproteobacteria bacterium]